jgi:hypothetical protein
MGNDILKVRLYVTKLVIGLASDKDIRHIARSQRWNAQTRQHLSSKLELTTLFSIYWRL